MEIDEFRTPKKVGENHYTPVQLSRSNSKICTPQGKIIRNETFHSMAKKSGGNLHIFPIVSTPPSLFPKVKNPFEPALMERLHLPLICSPSLFQRPSTPQLCSTQFEWTIDEVSSLNPANVEPHETQFQATPDPYLEAKAQAAISSYFKEQQIVPSPVDCQLRKQKIILTENEDRSFNTKPARRIRDGICQTILTFPPVLAIEVEALLKKYFTYTENQQQSPTINCDTSTDYDARDASLRRKLFEIPCNQLNESCDFDSNDLICSERNILISPPPTTPELNLRHSSKHFLGCNNNSKNSTATSGSPKISVSPIYKNSFGSLSPISKHDATEAFDEFDSNEMKKAGNSKENFEIKDGKACDIKPKPDTMQCFRSTPEHTITKMSFMSVDMSCEDDLIVKRRACCMDTKSTEHENDNIFNHSDIADEYDNDDEDEMQVSQLSTRSTSSSSSSSQHLNTPIRKRRSASRKNLSQSFSYHYSDEDDGPNDGFKKISPQSDMVQINFAKMHTNSNEEFSKISHTSDLYRTDSGFNDMTTSQEESKVSGSKKLNDKFYDMILQKKNQYSDKKNICNVSHMLDSDISFTNCLMPFIDKQL